MRPGTASLALALSLAGCTLPSLSTPGKLFEPERPLVFDRPADLLPPENLRATATERRQIALTWNPVLVGEVEGYAILRSTQPAPETFSVVGRTDSRFGSVFVDGDPEAGELGDGQTYYYRVHPYDASLHVSRSHAALSASTLPRPAPPSGLRAYSNLPRRVVLYWDANARLGVTGYGVDRAPTAAGPWERIAFVEGRLQTSYDDPVPGDLRVLYYRIAALNAFGGESDLTKAVRAVTKAEPLPPIDVSALSERIGELDVRWAPNVERDLVHYEVWRASRGGSGWVDEVLVGQVQATGTGLVDAGVGCGESLRYRVRAVDRDGLVSGFSVPLEASGLDLDLRLETRPDGVRRLHWSADRLGDWPGVRIYGIRSPLPDSLIGEVVGDSHFDFPASDPPTAQIGVALFRPESAGQSAATGPMCELASGS